MLRDLLSRIQSVVLAFPQRVIVASLALVAIALALGMGVEFRTSRSELAPPDDPDQRRFDELMEQFMGATPLIAALEAAPGSEPDPDRLRAHADALAIEFDRDPLVEQVFHRIDLDWILERGLYLAPPAALEAAAEFVEGDAGIIDALARVRGLADLNDLIAGRIEAGLAQASLPDSDAAAGVERLADLLRAERTFIEAPGPTIAALAGQAPFMVLAGNRPEIASRGYLASDDGRTLYLIIGRRDRDDSLPALRSLVGAMRQRAADLAGRRPGFEVTFTGEPATTVEEMAIVRRDTWMTTIVALLGVTLLALLVFRWKMHAMLLLAALAMGIAWAFGAVRLELGYLNLITSSFIPTLVGVGIAYGIHPVSEYELEGAHTSDPIKAIRGAYHLTGAAVTVSAITTATAFFGITLMEFRGFSELGLVAGVGVLLCLFAALLTLPALLAVLGRWRHKRDRETRAGPPSAAVDRIWDRHGAPLVCRFPRSTSIVALLLTAALGWSARDIDFDINILELLPSDAESVRSQKRMVMQSNLSPAFNVVVADDLDGLRALRERAAGEPTIDRVESALMFLPQDAERSRKVVARLRAILARARLPDAMRSVDRKRWLASVRRLQSGIERSAEAAFSAGFGELAGPLERARGETLELIAAIESAPAGSEAEWGSGQDRLLGWAHEALGALRLAAASEPPTVDSLPDSLRKRFFTRDGRPMAFLQPAEDVFETTFLEEYAAASRRVSPEAAGFPIVLLAMARRITTGFYASIVTGAILVILILLIDFRNVRHVALAILPLGLGVIWMLGGMRLLGLQFNFANLVVVPLIIGVGIDNGVHMVHRMRHEGEQGMTVVLRHTGRAIIIAGLTTMTGFGSLALASHQGMASLGLSLLIGVGACVVTAIVVLPNLLVATGQARR